MTTPTWVPIFGELAVSSEGVTFHGKVTTEGQVTAAIGLTNRTFAGGAISVDVEFTAVTTNSVCEIVLWYDPSTKNMLTAGMGGGRNMFSVRFFNDAAITETKWTIHRGGGSWTSIEPKRRYRLSAALLGSQVAIAIDGVVVTTVDTQLTLPPSQVGLFFLGESDCVTSRFEVSGARGRAFVVMEFDAPYNELYRDVIQPVCQAADLDVHRADETFGPGLIISDIVSSIQSAKLVIAEITPTNANVFFEVGYAYAIRKPTILLAVNGTKLPFDVSPFRTLFYENSIGGRRRVEEGLLEHVKAALKTGENLGAGTANRAT
jgi:hypothetical protein